MSGIRPSALDAYFAMRGIRRNQEEFDKTAEYVSGVRQRTAEQDIAAQPGKIRQIGYQDTANTMANDLGVAAHPNDMRGEVMEGDQQQQDMALREINYPDELENARSTAGVNRVIRSDAIPEAQNQADVRAVQRTDAVPEAQGKVDVRRIERPEEVRAARAAPAVNMSSEAATTAQNRATTADSGVQELQSGRALGEEKDFQYWQGYERDKDAYLEGFAQTGNPMYIQQGYTLVDDGETVEITRNPDGTYSGVHSGVGKVDKKVTKKELYEGTKRMLEGNPGYQNYLANKQGVGSATSTIPGAGGYGSYGGVGKSGRSGGTRGGALPAQIQAVNDYANTLQASGQYGNLSPADIRALAWNNVLNKQGEVTERDIMEMKMDLYKLFLKPGLDGRVPPVEEARSRTDQIVRMLVEDYEQRKAQGGSGDGGGVGGDDDAAAAAPDTGVDTSGAAAGKPAAGTDEAALPEISQRWIDILKSNRDNPRAVEKFEERYGPGSAASYLQDE